MNRPMSSIVVQTSPANFLIQSIACDPAELIEAQRSAKKSPTGLKNSASLSQALPAVSAMNAFIRFRASIIGWQSPEISAPMISLAVSTSVANVSTSWSTYWPGFSAATASTTPPKTPPSFSVSQVNGPFSTIGATSGANRRRRPLTTSPMLVGISKSIRCIEAGAV